MKKTKDKKHYGCGTLIVIILIFVVGMYVGQKSGINLPDNGAIDLVGEYAERLWDAVKYKVGEITGREDLEPADVSGDDSEYESDVFEEAPGVDYTVNRILYADLSKDGKYIYRALYKAALTHEAKVFVPTVSEDELKEIHAALKYDNPQIPCFGDKFTYSAIGKISYIKLNYCYTKEACSELSDSLIAKAKEIVGKCTELDDFRKELFIHDYIINNAVYSDENNSAYDASGIILDNKGVCASYALSMKMLLDAAGIKSFIIHGNAEDESGKQPHAWLCVNCDGKWYHVDPTWDDPTGDDGKDVLVHTYFNVTTKRIKADHCDFNMPESIKCTSLDRNYFAYMGLYCNASDWYDVMTRTVKENLNSTVTEFEFMFENEQVYNDACAEISNGGLNRIIQSAVLYNGYSSFSWNTYARKFDKPCALHYIITLK